MAEFQIPTEVVDLPSKGLVYPENSSLSSGKVEMKYMTAKEEDILTNQAYIEEGTVIDRLFKSLIVSKDINYDDLIVGDKNAIMVAARVLGYGAEYEFFSLDRVHKVDLSKVENKPIDESFFTKGQNEFEFELPHSSNKVTFKLLTGHDEKKISQELAGLKKLKKEDSPELTTRLKYMIISVNGDNERKTVREFVDKALLARDSRALREYINKNQPDVDLSFFPEGSKIKRSIPININFFWPDA
jgi:hypothetical protein